MSRVLNQLLASILVNSFYEMRNYPVVLLNTVLSPFSFLLIITLASKGTLFAEGIEGGLIMTMFSAGTSLQADLSHLKNDFKLQDVVVATPTSALVYVAGMTISELIYASPALVLLSILFGIYVHVDIAQLGAVVAVMLLMFLSSISLGFLLATISSDIVQSYAFSRLFSTLFSTIPPVYYPITYIPEPFRYLAYLSPTTYASEIAQNAAGLLSVSGLDLTAAWAILIGTTIAFFVVTIKKSRWRDK
jgi:ABC-2 type transport system permease protein